MWLDAKYLNPFFTRRLTQEVRETAGPQDVAEHSHRFALCSCLKGTISINILIEKHTLNAKQVHRSVVKLLISLMSPDDDL